MIIWGWKVREQELGLDRCHCRYCGGREQFRTVRVATYFTLYFIPLFETEYHGEYVQCCRCGQRYDPEVVEPEPRDEREQMKRWARSELASGTPLEMVVTKMVNADVAEQYATKLVGSVAGGRTHRCEACELTFLHSVSRCSKCGAGL